MPSLKPATTQRTVVFAGGPSNGIVRLALHDPAYAPEKVFTELNGRWFKQHFYLLTKVSDGIITYVWTGE